MSILQEGPLFTSVLFTLAITVPEIMENIQSDVQWCFGMLKSRYFSQNIGKIDLWCSLAGLEN